MISLPLNDHPCLETECEEGRDQNREAPGQISAFPPLCLTSVSGESAINTSVAPYFRAPCPLYGNSAFLLLGAHL